MADNKYLWRATVRRVSRPVYIVAQNMQSAQAQASRDPQVDPADVTHMQRIDLWDPVQNMTQVNWPAPPPPTPPEETPTP